MSTTTLVPGQRAFGRPPDPPSPLIATLDERCLREVTAYLFGTVSPDYSRRESIGHLGRFQDGTFAHEISFSHMTPEGAVQCEVTFGQEPGYVVVMTIQVTKDGKLDFRRTMVVASALFGGLRSCGSKALGAIKPGGNSPIKVALQGHEHKTPGEPANIPTRPEDSIC